MATVGPGHYEENNTLVYNMHGWTIGEKREEQVQVTLGPGQYQHEEGDGLTKNRAPMALISPAKDPSPIQATIGPGAYEEYNNIVNNMRSWTIGEKRE